MSKMQYSLKLRQVVSHIARKARKIIDEMIANLSFGVIHFANGIARYFWNHLYKGINVTGDETVRSLVQNGHEIIYIPTHRSHMDYLLLAYVKILLRIY